MPKPIEESDIKAVLSQIKDIKKALKANPSPALADAAIRRGIESSRLATDLLATIRRPWATMYTRLEKALLIWMKFDIGDGDPLVDSHTEPLNNWAKVRRQKSGHSFYAWGDELNFYFLWQNQTGADAAVNVSSFLTLNGVCQLRAESAVIVAPEWAGGGLDGEVELKIDAELSIYEWWNQPPTEPTWQQSQREHVLTESVHGGWGPVVGPGRWKTVRPSGNYHLNYSTFFVANDHVVLFEVGLRLWSWGRDGGVDLDFSTGELIIQCPYLLLEVMTPLQPVSPM